jgi:hypothetical protein
MSSTLRDETIRKAEGLIFTRKAGFEYFLLLMAEHEREELVLSRPYCLCGGQPPLRGAEGSAPGSVLEQLDIGPAQVPRAS